MAFKIFFFLALVAVVKAGVLPNAHLVAAVQSPAHYNFGYQVNDPITGDNKHQEETRVGDAVRGSYSLVESDGTRRVVEYFDDGVSGFNALVRKEPLVAPHVSHAVIPQPILRVAPPAVHVAAPAVHVAAHAAHVAAVPAVRGWSGLYSPYPAAYSNPWYSHY